MLSYLKLLSILIKKCAKRSADNERYFFKKSEVETVLSNLLHPEWVKVKIEYDVDGITPFCYTMDYNVIHRSTKKQEKNLNPKMVLKPILKRRSNYVLGYIF